MKTIRTLARIVIDSHRGRRKRRAIQALIAGQYENDSAAYARAIETLERLTS